MRDVRNIPVLPQEKRLIISTDAKDIKTLQGYVDAFGTTVGAIGLKKEVGHERLLTTEAIKALRRGASLFVDSQLDLVPFAMYDAVSADMRHFKPRFLTLHGNAGEEAMAKAFEAKEEFYNGKKDKLEEHGIQIAKLLVIPIMPDYSREHCRLVHRCEPEEWTATVARWAIDSGMDGMYCGSWSISAIHESLSANEQEDFTVVMTGIRRACHIGELGQDLIGNKFDVCTPARAVELGASLLHVGLTLTSAQEEHWAEAYMDIYTEMQFADARMLAKGAGLG